MNTPSDCTFYAKDGELIKCRPLRPEDAPYLVDLFDHMSLESRFFRFNMSLANPDRELVWSEAVQMAQVDAQRDGAWLVFADLPEQPNAPVGGVRFMRIDDHSAEASLVVRDDMQNKGIGSALIKFLVEQAREAGIHKLVATVQRNNRPLMRLLKNSSLPLEYDPEGSYMTVTAWLSENNVHAR